MNIETNIQQLYRISGILAIAGVLVIPIQIFLFITWPPPNTAQDFFLLFQKNWFLGLLSLDLLYMLNNVLLIVVYLGLYAALKHTQPWYLLSALALGFTGIAAYFSSTIAFEMLSLSNQYTLANTNELKLQCLAAGQTLLAIYKGTAFNIYYVLNAFTLLIISGSMLRDNTFSRATAAWGLMSGILMLIPSTAGTIGLVFAMASLIPWCIFSILTALRFFKLSYLSPED